MEALKRQAARETLDLANVTLNIVNAPNAPRPGIFVGNHVGYLDIPIVAAAAPVSFVAKDAIQKWPIIGKTATFGGSVFVNRSSKISRGETAAAIASHLTVQKQSIAVFPAGTSTLSESIPWRWRVFEIAMTLGVPIYPFRITVTPLRKMAFIGEDKFLPHLLSLLCEENKTAKIEFGEPFLVTDPQIDAERTQAWTRC
jgi:1-acyl-sn-glycerol-3-phosphate acyltransferase